MVHAEQVKVKQQQARAAIHALEDLKDALLTRRHLNQAFVDNQKYILSLHDGILQHWAEEVAEFVCETGDNHIKDWFQLCVGWEDDTFDRLASQDDLSPLVFSL